MENLEALLVALTERAGRGMDLGLERMRVALRSLGSPDEKWPALHVAGTNGKGSTSAMLESIGRAAGLRVGTYTSPHLCRFAERIRIGGQPIDDEPFASALHRVLVDASPELTFFETMTATAFVAFAEASVDLAVVEVGLGGRYDATNILRSPLAAGVVSIARGVSGRYLDHSDRLGTTVAAIAREKAAIAKPGRPLVVGDVSDEAFAAICDEARGASGIYRISRGAAPVDLPSVRSLAATDDEVELADGRRITLAPRLVGAHQRSNAAVAAVMAGLAGPLSPSGEVIERGIANAEWPGRCERFEREGRTVLLDCAHNVDGVAALIGVLMTLPLDSARDTLVFGALADKAFAPMLEMLAPHFAARIYAEPEGRAPAKATSLDAIAPGEGIADASKAFDAALARTPKGGVVVITGSIYLVGQVRAHLLGQRRDPAIAL